jgi:RNA-directed DNA polymerase
MPPKLSCSLWLVVIALFFVWGAVPASSTKSFLLAGWIILLLVLLIWRPRSRHPRRRVLECPVPQLPTLGVLAIALKVTPRRLGWLQGDCGPDPQTGISIHYRQKMIPKRSGGERTLLIPKPELMAAQRWILRNILDCVPLHDAAYGFRRGRSALQNAQKHCARAVVVTCDLRDFFPSINCPRVAGVFRLLGYSEPVARTLALLCTTRLPKSSRRVLPQGAPSSPALSNIVAFHMDTRLAALSAKLGFTYTRYADDCTFSGDDPAHLGALIRGVRRIVTNERFRLHEKKLHIRRRGARQQVTGIVVNQRPGVPRAERRHLRAVLHQARRTSLEEQNRQGHPNFLDYLRGKLAYIRMVNPWQAASLEATLKPLIPPKPLYRGAPRLPFQNTGGDPR